MGTVGCRAEGAIGGDGYSRCRAEGSGMMTGCEGLGAVGFNGFQGSGIGVRWARGCWVRCVPAQKGGEHGAGPPQPIPSPRGSGGSTCPPAGRPRGRAGPGSARCCRRLRRAGAGGAERDPPEPASVPLPGGEEPGGLPGRSPGGSR